MRFCKKNSIASRFLDVRARQRVLNGRDTKVEFDRANAALEVWCAPEKATLMRSYSRSAVSDHQLQQNAKSRAQQECASTAEFLADLAEIDARRLFAPAGYSSMLAYCVGELGLFDQAAKKRIRVARIARRFPAILPAIADGRLHLTAVLMLSRYLTRENAQGLLSVAEKKTMGEIQELIARRFPQSESLQLIEALPVSRSREVLSAQTPIPSCTAGSEEVVSARTAAGVGESPEQVSARTPASVAAKGEVSSRPVSLANPAEDRTTSNPPASRMSALAPQRFALHLSIGQTMRDKLDYARELMSHQLPDGDMVTILERGLDLLIAKLERQKFAAASKPRSGASRPSANPRRIPAHVKRAVRARDGGCCTFVGENGHRCNERRFLQFDHITPVARGGQSTVENLRQRCAAHNRLEAERVFGAGFIDEKRSRNRRAPEADLSEPRQSAVLPRADSDSASRGTFR